MLKVSNLSKKYGGISVIDSVSFEVDEGEIFGLLGPRGSGKTTVMNIISGYAAADSGSVEINGIDLMLEPLKARGLIGYMPETPPLYENMTVFEYLGFAAELKRVNRGEIQEAVQSIMKRIGVGGEGNRLIQNLSKGFRQKINLAQSALGSPKLLILDEPTAALDALHISEIRDIVKELGKSHAIVLSSHSLTEVNELCSRAAILSDGRITVQGSTESLSSDSERGCKLKVRVCGKPLGEIMAFFEADTIISSFVYEKTNESDVYDFILETANSSEDIRVATFNNAVKNGYKILMMKPVKSTLEEMFLKASGEAVEASPLCSETLVAASDINSGVDTEILISEPNDPELSIRESEETCKEMLKDKNTPQTENSVSLDNCGLNEIEKADKPEKSNDEEAESDDSHI